MPITDDDHRLARIIKDIERRVTNLEERSRDVPTPQLLITTSDTVTVSDSVTSVQVQTIETMEWDRIDAATTGTGWKTSSWGAYTRV